MVDTGVAEGGGFVAGAAEVGRPVVCTGVAEGGGFVAGAAVVGRRVVCTGVAEGGEFVAGAAVVGRPVVGDRDVGTPGTVVVDTVGIAVVAITVAGTAVDGAKREIVAFGRHRPLIPPGRQVHAEVAERFLFSVHVLLVLVSGA